MNDFIIERLDIQSNKHNIYGLLYKPNNMQMMPLAIYSHELANTHERGVLYAEELAKNGIACYIFDYPGGSNESKSDGLTTEMSPLTEEKALEDIVLYLRDLPFIDDTNLYLIGASLGGLVASLVASFKPELIKRLILLYPGFNLYDAFHSIYKCLEDVPQEFSFRGWINVSDVFVSDIWYCNPYELIGNYQKKVLILHGDEDKLVPLSYSQKALKVYSNAKLIIIKNASHHIFFGENQVETQKEILAFIKEGLEE